MKKERMKREKRKRRRLRETEREGKNMIVDEKKK